MNPNFFVICMNCKEKSNVQVMIDIDKGELKFECKTCSKEERQKLMTIDKNKPKN